ncbi:MAG: hypothetical protein EXR71_15355 [Myxococcales bacterium]|nr:hypothetical protein [Myxococcales bacterium]
MLLHLLLACTEDPPIPSVRLLSGLQFGWRGFNHRLSHLGVQVTDDTITYAVVGGTSTTGVVPTYAAGCDEATCKEFPFVDTADLVVSTTVLSDPALRVARYSVVMRVGASGSTASVTLPWAELPAVQTPVINGLVVQSVGAEHDCYDPSFGWLPTHLAVKVEADGPHATVTAAFESGVSLEEARGCLDEAAPGAEAILTIDVLGVAGVAATWAPLSQSASWNQDGSALAEQTPPAPEALALPDVRAFSSLEWFFHEADADGRGAYLRTLTADSSGAASATNYSPGTQLSGFDYRFVGTVVGFEGDGAGERKDWALHYTPALDDDGGVNAMNLAEDD